MMRREEFARILPLRVPVPTFHSVLRVLCEIRKPCCRSKKKESGWMIVLDSTFMIIIIE